MRLSEYLEVNKKLKSARMTSGFSQSNMAEKLGLSTSAYSNYENGYSDPPVEVLQNFCSIVGMDMKSLLELDVQENRRSPLETFSQFFDDLIEMQNAGIKSSYSMKLDGQSLSGIMQLSSPQIATMVSGIQELNDKLAEGKISQEQYLRDLDSLRQLYNVKIEGYI